MASPIVTLDIGGKTFRVLRETILKYPESTLAQVLTGKDTHNLIKVDNSYFFDRNPHYFEVVLDFMRNGKLIKPDKLSSESLAEELKFWKIKAAPGHEAEPSRIPDAPFKVDPLHEQIDATLVVSMDEIEPTLLIPDELQATQGYDSTLLIDQMEQIEPTLLMADMPSTQVILEDAPVKPQPRQESNRSSRTEYVPIDKDDLLGALLNTQPDQPREERKLPWGNKAAQPKKAAGKPVKRRKIGSEAGSDVSGGTESYDSSFIDDREAEELFKEKPKVQTRTTAASRYKKVPLPTAAEMKQAIQESARKADPPKAPAKIDALKNSNPTKRGDEPPLTEARGPSVELPKKRQAESIEPKAPVPEAKPRVFIYGFEGTKKTQIGTKVRKLGGEVVKRLEDRPTHVIMPDFKKDLAQMQGLQLASEDWLETSLRQSSWTSASAFNPLP